MKTIDMTRQQGKLTHVDFDFQSIVLHTMENVAGVTIDKTAISFLREVTVSGVLRCCYFSNGDTFPDDDDTAFFEIGTLKLPAGFQYVDYLGGSVVPAWNNKGARRDNDLFTNVLLKLNSEKQNATSFHLCVEDQSGLYGGAYHGCSGLIAPYSSNKKRDFILFYYEVTDTEWLYFADASGLDGKPDNLLGYFLIPMALSERIVVYYVIQHLKVNSNHETILNNFRNDANQFPERMGCIAINEALQLNDKLGIFVTRDITPMQPAEN